MHNSKNIYTYHALPPIPLKHLAAFLSASALKLAILLAGR